MFSMQGMCYLKNYVVPPWAQKKFIFLAIDPWSNTKDNEEDYPKASQEILENMYVDDLLSGSDESAIQLKDEMTELMKSG